MDFVRLDMMIVDSIEKVAREACGKGVGASPESIEPDFSELDSVGSANYDGVDVKICDAFRAKFAAKVISREMFGIFLKEKSLSDIEGQEIGDVDGDGINDLMKEFAHEDQSLFIPAFKMYCGESGWKVPEIQSKHFWFAIELSKNRDYVLIESVATLVRMR